MNNLLIISLCVGMFLSSCRSESGSKTMNDPQPSQEGKMKAFSTNGFQLSGAEYWPHVADTPFHYPDDVLWGFYPDQATEQAVACAKKAYDRLREFLGSNPEKMKKVVQLGATSHFYLWTDDYTKASPNRARRKNSMWHWNSGDHDYSQGYWKWESVVTQTGECLIPQDPQIDAVLLEAIDFLQGNQ
ncbi:MAG: hypothetical protein AB7T49_08075 [Oligoflexales bacterium]